jgi:outer membrane protein TolC
VFDEVHAAIPPVERYLNLAGASNADLNSARYTKAKAHSGVRAAFKEYLPEMGFISGYSHQSGIDYYAHDNFYAGVLLTWTLFDWGGRPATIRQRQIQEDRASEHVKEVEQQVRIDVAKAYRALVCANEMIEVAQKTVD